MGSIQPELSCGIEESVLAFCTENYEAGVPVEIDGLICMFDTKAKEYKIVKIHTTFTKPEVMDQTNKYSQMDEISQDSSRILYEDFPSIVTAGTGNNSNLSCAASNSDGIQFVHKEDENNHVPSEREVQGSHAKVIQCKHDTKFSDISNMHDIAPMQKSYMGRSTSCKPKQIHNEKSSPESVTACGSHQQMEEENHLSNSSSACRSMVDMPEDSVFHCYEISGSERNTALRQNEGAGSGNFHKNHTGVSFLTSKKRNATERNNDEISCKQKEAIGERFDSLSSLTNNSPSPGQQETIPDKERHKLGQPLSKNVVEKCDAIIKSEPLEREDFVESVNTETVSDAVGPYGNVVQYSAAQNILEQLSPTINSVSYRAWTHTLSDIIVRNPGRADIGSLGSGIVIETNSLHVPSSSIEDSYIQKSKLNVSRQSISLSQGSSANNQYKATAHHTDLSKFNQQTTADKKRESGTHRYCCAKCGTCFMHRTNLRRHIAASCSSKRIKAPCSICGKLLLNRSDSLKRHIETVHYKKSSSLISLARTFI
ncbi:hypothetical protein ACJMK2_041767 [Sinanodonta woodiana]|uniref:C2H2-type domain-containing protein n=1 Tax=Sinanodonta woodiana TaxID=1069815 RepID=A0ABD3W675_SINWO